MLLALVRGNWWRLNHLFSILFFFQVESVESNDTLKRLYELFASARLGDKFSSHLRLLQKRLSDGLFPFLSEYFISGGKKLNHIAPSVVFKQKFLPYACVAFPHQCI